MPEATENERKQKTTTVTKEDFEIGQMESTRSKDLENWKIRVTRNRHLCPYGDEKKGKGNEVRDGYTRETWT